MWSYKELLNKEIVLCGVGKFQQDIEDFFYDLKITYYLEKYINNYNEVLNKKKIFNLLEYKRNQNELIIITSFDFEEYSNTLVELGFEYEKDFIFGTDLIKLVDESETFYLAQEGNSRKIIVLGVENECQIFMSKNPNLEVEYFIDDNKKDGLFFGKEIKKLEELKKEKLGEFVVIVASANIYTIKKQLLELGLRFGEDFYFYYNLNIKPSELLLKTIKEKPKYKQNCDYRHLTTDLNLKGELVCCHSFSKFPLGNICYNTIPNIIRSTYAKIIRLSTINKTYTFCSNECLIKANKNNLIELDENVERNKIPLYDMSNFRIGLGYDATCNLSCISCRNNKVINSNSKITEHIHNEVIKYLDNMEFVFVSYGEVFFSKYYLDLVLSKNNEKHILIQTNGLLLNEDMLSKLDNKYESIDLYISIDAATKETYRTIRGEDFNILLKNLKMISDFKKTGKIKNLVMSFVVQKNNFREMIKFIEMGKRLNVDKLFFARFKNWRNLPEEEFIQFDVYNPQNECHNEFLEMLKNSIFRDSAVIVQNIENYID